MIEQEINRRKNRRRKGKKKTTANNAHNVQVNNNIQGNSDIEEPVAKKIRLDSQEVYTEAQLELTSKNEERLFNTQQTVSVLSSLNTSSQVEDMHSNIKTYMITKRDLIQLAQIKEDEQCVDRIGVEDHRPVIVFSISDNDLVHLELVQGKEDEQENEITKNFKEKEHIENFKGNGQIKNSNDNGPENFKENGHISNSIGKFIKNEMPENFKENGHISNSIGKFIKNEMPENFKENGHISNSIRNFIENEMPENFKENGHVSNSVQVENIEYEQIENEYLEIPKNISEKLLMPTSSKQLPPGLKKYWCQRYLFFSLYDEGIMMDEEGWYSVTPEYLAEYIAKRCACDTIIDAMCGVGGNAIQFAKTCKKVIAIDIDETKLYCARNNASKYGVEDKIEFILGDFYDLVPQLKELNADVVFLSPPWGGPSYLKSKVYDIKTMIPVDGEKLFRESRKITKNIAYYVPRSINLDQMKRLCDSDEICEFQRVIAWEKFKSYVVYYGDLVGNYCSETIEVPSYWADDTSADYIQKN